MIRRIENIEMPMRDGVILRADLYRPEGEEPLPVILLRLPYGKDAFDGEGAGIYNPYYYAEQGYCVVIQDCRGFYHSDGEPDPSGLNDPEDGYDTVEWIAAQPFCDGNIGTFGLSFFGYVQLALAVKQPPHLKCICPFECSAERPPFVNGNGSYAPYHLTWLYNSAEDQVRRLPVSEEEKARIWAEIEKNRPTIMDQVVKIHPWTDMPALNIEGFRYFDEYMESVDGTNDPEYWARIGYPLKPENMPYPVFLCTGWNDHVRDQEMENYRLFQKAQAAAPDPERLRLVIGPWSHGPEMSNVIGKIDYGKETAGSEMGIMGMMLRFFDRWLKGKTDAMKDDSPVVYCTLNEKGWKTAEVWPVPETEYENWYFTSDGNARSSSGTGKLTQECGTSGEGCGNSAGEDTILHDPMDPVPSELPGLFKMNGDFSGIQERQDVLVYTSEPQASDTELTGPVSAEIWFRCDAEDGDLYVRLSDVGPDGSSIRITSGELRLRFRDSKSEAKYVPEGTAGKYRIAMGDISYLLSAGHRIRVDIAGSSFPYADANLGTKEPLGRGANYRTALLHVLHDGEHPSFITLPVIRRS
ncbi:MAG: CocE/NonD family hydrolase [Lachnospiraceae bacterium]|nr:CocE/NonD family hydrolase [Lachnospiraceae bacterium]